MCVKTWIRITYDEVSGGLDRIRFDRERYFVINPNQNAYHAVSEQTQSHYAALIKMIAALLILYVASYGRRENE